MLRAVCAITLIVVWAMPVTAWGGNPFAGKKVWESHSCPSCHGKKGVPVVPGVPSFANGDRMIKPDRQLIATIARGKGIMPSWRGILTKKQMVNVVTYIRALRKR